MCSTSYSPVSGGLLGSAVEHEGVLLEGVPGQAAHVTAGAGTTGGANMIIFRYDDSLARHLQDISRVFVYFSGG